MLPRSPITSNGPSEIVPLAQLQATAILHLPPPMPGQAVGRFMRVSPFLATLENGNIPSQSSYAFITVWTLRLPLALQ